MTDEELAIRKAIDKNMAEMNKLHSREQQVWREFGEIKQLQHDNKIEFENLMDQLKKVQSK